MAAKRSEIGSISFHRQAVRSHIYTTIYGCRFASVTLTPVVLIVPVGVPADTAPVLVEPGVGP